jgi:glycosyltransferase involved in cell wall biosynthesis
MIKTGTKNFTVSVIITLFNSGKFYKRALRSLLDQTFRNYEVIIVDDGSEDNVENEIFRMLKSNENEPENIKYLRHSNRGHPLSLNSGILISSGKYITFLDSDDEYSYNHLELRVKYFKKNNVDLIFSPAKLTGDEKDFFVPDRRNKKKLIHINKCVIGGTIFGKREVLFDLNGFRNIYSHDSDLVKRAEKNFKVVKLDVPTYIYHRDNPGSVTQKLKVDQ